MLLALTLNQEISFEENRFSSILILLIQFLPTCIPAKITENNIDFQTKLITKISFINLSGPKRCYLHGVL